MSEMKITFKHPDEILDFVNTVSKYEFDMDMKKGHVVVDAKSLLGIMHLGINNEIALQNGLYVVQIVTASGVETAKVLINE